MKEGGGGNCGNMFGDLFFVRTVTETCWYYFPKIAYLQMKRISSELEFLKSLWGLGTKEE